MTPIRSFGVSGAAVAGTDAARSQSPATRRIVSFMPNSLFFR